jgi:uncharacterized damage-inducible protein DinB
MNKQTLERRWDVLRMHYGIFLRVLETIPSERLHDHPIPGMRTPAELVAHTAGGIVRDVAAGVATGEIAHGQDEKEAAAALSTTDDAVAYATSCWQAANEAMASVGDTELGAEVATPWNMTLSGSTAVNLLSDEFLHHRGQLYAFARACGGEPPFVWSFDQNTPEFAPRQTASTS